MSQLHPPRIILHTALAVFLGASLGPGCSTTTQGQGSEDGTGGKKTSSGDGDTIGEGGGRGDGDGSGDGDGDGAGDGDGDGDGDVSGSGGDDPGDGDGDTFSSGGRNGSGGSNMGGAFASGGDSSSGGDPGAGGDVGAGGAPGAGGDLGTGGSTPPPCACDVSCSSQQSCYFGGCYPYGNETFRKKIDTGGSGEDEGKGIAHLPDHRFLVAASAQPAGETRLWLASYEPNGAEHTAPILWDATNTNVDLAAVGGVATEPSGAFAVVGHSLGSMGTTPFIVRFDDQGAYQWSFEPDAVQAEFYDIAYSGTHYDVTGLATNGSFALDYAFPITGSTPSRATTLGSDYITTGFAIDVSPEDGRLGYAGAKATAAGAQTQVPGTLLWGNVQASAEFRDLTFASDGTVWVCGANRESADGKSTAYHFDLDGNLITADTTHFDGATESGEEICNSVVPLDDGTLVMVGKIGDSQGYVAKLNIGGGVVWSTLSSPPINGSVEQAIVDACGGVQVTGYVNGTNGRDIFIAGYAP